MELTVGEVYEGKVKSLTKFGAFVLLPGGATGMVHISEVAYTFVNEIRDFLTEGQDVKVMVIGMDKGKINLSIKRTQPQQRPGANRDGRERDARPERPRQSDRPRQPTAAAPAQPQQRSLDDMLKQFMSDSNSKMASSRLYSEHKTKTRRR